MRGVVLAVGLAGLLAGAAHAQVVVNPDWARRPSAEVMTRYFPEEAVDRSVSGRVTLQCVVSIEGRLENCSVTSESPAGMGFGDAVLTMAEKEFRMKPRTVDGKPVGGVSIRLPVVMLASTGSARFVITDAVWAEARPSRTWPPPGPPGSETWRSARPC